MAFKAINCELKPSVNFNHGLVLISFRTTGPRCIFSYYPYFILIITATSQFIPIKKLGLPVRPSRQFRRVNEAFVDSLKEELLQEPSGSHGCLFMFGKGIESKETFDPAKKDVYEYEVLGGTHLMLATKKLHSQFPENIYYQGRMARIYCGLTDDQAIYLSAMHQKFSSFCHDIACREEVHFVKCRI